MEQLLETEPGVAIGASGISIWRSPRVWLMGKKLSRDYWIFFSIEFFVDFGFSLYVFLFNLYLVDLHFNERTIGLVGGALSLSSVAGSLPAGWVARKLGLRPLLIMSMIAAPLLGVARVLVTWEPAQIGLAFLSGLALCIWAVCYLPTLAGLTTEENRASAFSLNFSMSIVAGALGGLVCAYVPRMLKAAGYALQAADVKRLILLGSCGIAGMAVIPLLQLRIPLSKNEPQVQDDASKQTWKMNPFLARYLPALALWTAALASFMPFANVYLTRDFNISLSQIGLIFAAAQAVQFCAGLLTPLVFRRLGLLNGIVATQVATAAAIACLAGTHNRGLAVALYLSFSATQWMSTPGVYNLLMSKVPEEERSSASAMTMFCNSVLQSAAMAGAGILLVRFGYPRVLFGIAVSALVAALLFGTLVSAACRRSPAQP